MNRRYPDNEIISLLDSSVKHELGESTVNDLLLGELLDDQVLAELRDLRLGYGTPQGDAALREQIANGTDVNADEVLVTSGAAAALFLSLFSLCQASDEVIVLSPNFPPTLDTIAAIGASARPLTTSFMEKYQLDLGRLEKLLNKDTRLILLGTPQNPSGVAISTDDLASAVELIERKSPGAYILVDETYREATYGDLPPLASSAGMSPRVLTVSSLSKAHGAPGLRIGWLTCRDRELMQQLILAKMNTVISCSSIDEVVARRLILDHSILSKQRMSLRESLVQADDWVQRHSDFVEWVRPDAGGLCCLRLKPDRFNETQVTDFYAKMAELQVRVANGNWFSDEHRVFRLGFGYLPTVRLEAALAALGTLLKATAKQ